MKIKEGGVMDIKQLEAFKAVAKSKGWNLDGETTPTGYIFYSAQTQLRWEGWQEAQAVPEGFGDIQSWIAVNSFSALDASIVDFPVVDANELAEFIDSLNIDVAVPEGFVLVEKKEFEQMQEFEDLYRRAIFNSKKSIHEVNWSHVSNLGVGSTKAKAMCKRFNIDPEATFRKTQEPAND